jgi:ribose transport system substrate-binding protein
MKKIIMNSVLFLIIFLVIISFTLFSCSGKKENNKIAFVVTTLSNPYFVNMTESAKEEIKKHPGFELIVQAPERGATDIERQIQIVENLIVQKVDAICIVPSDSKSILPVMGKANKANIPIINIDNKIDFELAKKDNIEVASYIGSDNYLGGKLAAEYIVKQLKEKGKVAILEGVSGVDAAIQRKGGFVDYVKNYPGIKIVASQTADWEREKGLNVFQNILQANPDVNALFASNDEMALGAIEAIKTAKKEGKIIVVGFDATKDGLNAVKNGSMAGSVAQLPFEMGKTGIIKAVELLEGKTIEKKIPTEVKLILK